MENIAKLRKYKEDKARRTEKVKLLDQMEENREHVDEATCKPEAKSSKEADDLSEQAKSSS